MPNNVLQDGYVSHPVLLWTNPNPTTSFSAQTIQLDLSDYDAIYYFAHNFGSTNAQYGLVGCLCPKGETTWACFWYSTSANTNGARKVTPSDSGVDVSAATFNDTTQNGFGIPYKIYGLKW